MHDPHPEGQDQGRLVPLHALLRQWLAALDRGAGPIIEPWPNDKREHGEPKTQKRPSS